MEAKESVQYPELAEEIIRMAKEDQEMREKGLDKAKLGDWSDFDENVDIKNTARMKEIIGQIGWPTINLVGKSASSDAWLLVQHADLDTDFQERCLEMMKALPDGEVNKRNIAMLEDRVLLARGKPQLYGTQFGPIEEGISIPRPIKDPEHVDERRKMMGLDTLAENQERMRKHYG